MIHFLSNGSGAILALLFLFLAHLSTKCSLWVIAIVRRTSVNINSSVYSGSISMKLHRKHPLNVLTRIPSNIVDPFRILVPMATRKKIKVLKVLKVLVEVDFRRCQPVGIMKYMQVLNRSQLRYVDRNKGQQICWRKNETKKWNKMKQSLQLRYFATVSELVKLNKKNKYDKWKNKN